MKRLELVSASEPLASYADHAMARIDLGSGFTLFVKVRELGFGMMWNAAAWVECEWADVGKHADLFDETFATRDDASAMAAGFLVSTMRGGGA